MGSNISYAHLGLGLAQVRLSLTRSINSSADSPSTAATAPLYRKTGAASGLPSGSLNSLFCKTPVIRFVA